MHDFLKFTIVKGTEIEVDVLDNRNLLMVCSDWNLFR